MNSLFPTLAKVSPRAVAVARARTYHTTPALLAYKNSQDRNSLKPGSTENTKSGRDEDIAKSDVAFDPNNTAPETEKDAGGDQPSSNPLYASGANQELSKPQGGEKQVPKKGAGKETQKGGTSRGGSGPKSSDPRNL